MKNQSVVPKKSKMFKKVLIVCAFIFIFSSCLGFASILSSVIIPTSTQVSSSITTPSFKLYFISLNKTQLENSACSLASDYQKLGAGGYVWKNDGYFHIVASCYEKENDAVLVQSNIKVNHDIESQIFTVDFPSLTLTSGYDNENKKVLAKTLKSFFVSYQSLFDIAVSLDTNVYNDISARLAVNSTYSSLNACLTDFKTLFSNSLDSSINLIQRHLEKANQILENLCSGKLVNQEQTYSSLIKYRYLQLLSTYKDLLDNFK